MAIRDIKLPSGNVLGLDSAVWEDASELKRIVADEMKKVALVRSAEMDFDFIKNLVCISQGSKRLDDQVQKCMEKCTYNGVRLTKDTWEPSEARRDYVDVSTHVIKENLLPFWQSLSAQFSEIFRVLGSFQGPESETKTG